MQALTQPAYSGTAFEQPVYLLYWYKRANTDAAGVQALPLIKHSPQTSTLPHNAHTGVLALLVQKYLLYWYHGTCCTGTKRSERKHLAQTSNSPLSADTGAQFTCFTVTKVHVCLCALTDTHAAPKTTQVHSLLALLVQKYKF